MTNDEALRVIWEVLGGTSWPQHPALVVGAVRWAKGENEAIRRELVELRTRCDELTAVVVEGEKGE